ncbi:MAG: type II secretion system F family protein [Candidatus Aenigmarchaeota archaeon]|nr:type II secretion system F family protein [Candidatus Aenigmarchaeota archaeon]
MDKKKIKNIEPPKRFLGFAEKLAPFFPDIKTCLSQSGNDMEPKDHIALSLYKSANMSTMMGAMFILLAIFLKNSQFLLLGAIIVPVMFAFGFYSNLYAPKAQALKDARKVDSELPYALRHLLIEIKSGIPIYQGLVTISEGYGKVSEDIKDMLKEINGGKSEIQALEENIIKNPSFTYRKSFWQILNSLKTGTALEKTLQSTVDNIIKEQILSIKRYGQELNPYTLMYMMIGVIVPSLGITFIMLISSFTGMIIGKSTFYALLVGLALFQIMFLNIVKTKRPLVKL